MEKKKRENINEAENTLPNEKKYTKRERVARITKKKEAGLEEARKLGGREAERELGKLLDSLSSLGNVVENFNLAISELENLRNQIDPQEETLLGKINDLINGLIESRNELEKKNNTETATENTTNTSDNSIVEIDNEKISDDKNAPGNGEVKDFDIKDLNLKKGTRLEGEDYFYEILEITSQGGLKVTRTEKTNGAKSNTTLGKKRVEEYFAGGRLKVLKEKDNLEKELRKTTTDSEPEELVIITPPKDFSSTEPIELIYPSTENNEDDTEEGKGASGAVEVELETIQPVEQTEELENLIRQEVERVIAEFGLEEFVPKSFDRMTEAQQLKTIRDLSQRVVNIVKQDAKNKYSEDLKNKMSKSSRLGKIFTGIKDALRKESDIKNIESKILIDLKNTEDGRKLIAENLKILTAKNEQQKISFGPGKFFIDYGEELGLGKDNENIIIQYNEAANKFRVFPHEWSLGKEGSLEKNEYEKAKASYELAFRKVLEVKRFAPGGEAQAMKDMLQVKNSLMLEQLLNTHPDLEQEFSRLGDEAGTKEMWATIRRLTGTQSTEAIGLTTAGAGLRWGTKAAALAVGGTTATVGMMVAAPVVGSLVGYWRAKIRTREALANQEKEARYGAENTGPGARNVASIESVDNKGREVGLKAKLDKLIEEIERLQEEDGKEEEVARLLISLSSRIKYTEGKIESGLVNFGDQKSALQNQYAIIESINKAVALVNAEELNTKRELDERLESFLEARGNRITKEQKDYIKKQAIKGAKYGAIAATAGYSIRWLGERTGLFGHRLELQNEQEVSPQSSPENITETNINTDTTTYTPTELEMTPDTTPITHSPEIPDYIAELKNQIKVMEADTFGRYSEAQIGLAKSHLQGFENGSETINIEELNAEKILEAKKYVTEAQEHYEKAEAYYNASTGEEKEIALANLKGAKTELEFQKKYLAKVGGDKIPEENIQPVKPEATVSPDSNKNVGSGSQYSEEKNQTETTTETESNIKKTEVPETKTKPSMPEKKEEPVVTQENKTKNTDPDSNKTKDALVNKRPARLAKDKIPSTEETPLEKTSPTKVKIISGMEAKFVVDKGLGVTHAFREQVQADAELGSKLAEQIGFKGQVGTPAFYKALGQHFGYIDKNGDEVRVKWGGENGMAAYQFVEGEDGKYGVQESHLVGDDWVKTDAKGADGEIFEAKTDDHIENPKYNKDETHDYEYLHEHKTRGPALQKNNGPVEAVNNGGPREATPQEESPQFAKAALVEEKTAPKTFGVRTEVPRQKVLFRGHVGSVPTKVGYLTNGDYLANGDYAANGDYGYGYGGNSSSVASVRYEFSPEARAEIIGEMAKIGGPRREVLKGLIKEIGHQTGWDDATLLEDTALTAENTLNYDLNKIIDGTGSYLQSETWNSMKGKSAEDFMNSYGGSTGDNKQMIEYMQNLQAVSGLKPINRWLRHESVEKFIKRAHASLAVRAREGSFDYRDLRVPGGESKASAVVEKVAENSLEISKMDATEFLEHAKNGDFAGKDDGGLMTAMYVEYIKAFNNSRIASLETIKNENWSLSKLREELNRVLAEESKN